MISFCFRGMTLGWLFGALCALCCLATTYGQFSCNAFANSTQSQEFVTSGGTVPAGTPCCFPFVYRGQVYYECTSRDNPQAWCAVESVYQENNKLWGNCQRIATPAPTTSSKYTFYYVISCSIIISLLEIILNDDNPNPCISN